MQVGLRKRLVGIRRGKVGFFEMDRSEQTLRTRNV